MADVKIAINDESSARAWLQKVMVTNEEYRDAMDAAAQVLQDTKDFGEGTLVDEFYDLGTKLMTATQHVFESLNEISTIVNSVLSGLRGMTEAVVEAITGTKSILGG